jgi:hypothetical protein
MSFNHKFKGDTKGEILADIDDVIDANFTEEARDLVREVVEFCSQPTDNLELVVECSGHTGGPLDNISIDANFQPKAP